MRLGDGQVAGVVAWLLDTERLIYRDCRLWSPHGALELSELKVIGVRFQYFLRSV
jgi:hypothetical protein